MFEIKPAVAKNIKCFIFWFSTRLLFSSFFIYYYTAYPSLPLTPFFSHTSLSSISLSFESLIHFTVFSLSLSRTQCHDVASVELLVADEATLMEEDAVLLLLVSLWLFHNNHQSLHVQLRLLLSLSLSLSHHRPRWLNWQVVSKGQSHCRIELRREGLATETSERKSKSEQIIFSLKSPI